MKKERKLYGSPALGYVCFFIMVAGIITCAILIYSTIISNVSATWQISVVMLVVVFMLSAVCLLIDFLRRKYTVEKPVTQILEATDKIANGNFDIQLKRSRIHGKYDIYDLIMENINRMAKELSQNEVLKTDFISNVSHEIKTPLSVIANYATLIQDPSLTKDEQNTCAENILSATRRLTDLVNNILKLNKLENQGIREQKTRLRLGDFIGEIILNFEDALDRKNIDLSVDIDDVLFYADKTFIEIICNNLLSNAIKFTETGGKISVSLKEDKDEIILSVKDNGCGIDKETGTHIFDKFYQGDTSHAGEGNGLGLALVKKVIDNMGGEINVKSKPGEGSLFTVKWNK